MNQIIATSSLGQSEPAVPRFRSCIAEACVANYFSDCFNCFSAAPYTDELRMNQKSHCGALVNQSGISVILQSALPIYLGSTRNGPSSLEGKAAQTNAQELSMSLIS